MHTANRSLVLLTLLAWLCGLCGVALAAECPKGKVVNDAGKEACGYVVTVLKVDSTAWPRGVLELPTTVIVGATAVFVPGIGWVVKNAYAAEQNRRYRAMLRPTPEFKDYVRVTQRQNAWSTRRAAAYNFYKMDDHSVTYRWRLKKGGVGEGRAWLKSDLVLISRHPNLSDWNEVEANEIAKQTLSELAQQRRASKSKAKVAPARSSARKSPV